MTRTRPSLSLRTAAVVAGSTIAALLTIPAVSSGAGTPSTTSTTTIAPTTTIIDGGVEGEGEVEPGTSPTTLTTDSLPDAEAAAADAVAGDPTFTG